MAILIFYSYKLCFFWAEPFFKNIFLTPVLGLGEITLGGMPLKYFLSQSIHAGRLPLWTDGIYAGVPLLSETTIGAFNPLSILYLLFNPFYAHSLNFFVGFFISMIFMYKYVRLLGLSKYSSTLSSIAFTFSGFITLRIMHNLVIDTVIWFPGAFYFTEKIIKKENLKDTLFLSLIFAIQIVAGAPQYALYSIFGCGVYLLSRLLFSKERLRVKKSIASFALSLLIAIGLSAVQTIPTLEYVVNSVRSKGLKTEKVKEYPMTIKELSSLVLPKMFGTPYDNSYVNEPEKQGFYWENTPYVGFVVFGLFLLALLTGFNACKLIFTGALLVFTGLSVGLILPLAAFLEIPPLNFFRMPSRFMIFSVFSIAILSAYGMEIIVKKFKNKGYLMLVLIFISVFELLSFGTEFNSVISYKKLYQVPQTAKVITKDNDKSRIFNNIIIGGKNINPDEIVLNREAGWSNGVSEYLKLTGYLKPNLNLVFGINNFGGSLALEMGRSREFIDLLNSEMINSFNEYGDEILNKKIIKLFNLASITHIISPYELGGESINLLEKVSEDNEINQYVYKNSKAFENVYLVDKLIYARDGKEAKELLVSETFDPEKEVIVEDEKLQLSEAENEGKSIGEIVEVKKIDNGSDVEIKCSNNSDAILVFTDTYYPGWIAYVDGRLSPIYRVNYIFRGVKLEKGEHKINFKYEPESVRIGILISVGTLIVCVVVMVGIIVWNKKNEQI